MFKSYQEYTILNVLHQQLIYCPHFKDSPSKSLMQNIASVQAL